MVVWLEYFLKLTKNIKYLIFDTKLVNLLQYYYLKQNKINVGFNDRNKFILKNDLKNLKNEKKNQYLLLIGLYLKHQLILEINF